MSVNVTEYIRPNGRKVIHEINVDEEQEQFFIDNNIELSVEQLGANAGVAWYAKHPTMEEEEELIHIDFGGKPDRALVNLHRLMANWIAENPRN